MTRAESNAKIDKLIAQLEKEFNADKIIPALMDLREDALKDEDPLLANDSAWLLNTSKKMIALIIP